MRKYLVLLVSLLLFSVSYSQDFDSMEGSYYGELYEVASTGIDEGYPFPCTVQLSRGQLAVSSSVLTGGEFYFTPDYITYMEDDMYFLDASSDPYIIGVKLLDSETVVFHFEQGYTEYFFMGYRY